MATINITIPDGKVAEVIAAFESRFAKEEGFTGAQWAKECLRRYIIAIDRQYKLQQAQDAVTGDDTIAS